MILTSMLEYRRLITCVVLPFVMLLVLQIPAVAEENSGSQSGTNVRWTTKGDLIVITYDLAGASDSKYSVAVIMKKEGDPSFTAVPSTLEGDVGEGSFAGVNKEIRWYYRRDFPQGFQGEGYYFEIQVQELRQPMTWLYYAIGAAAVTGGVIALLVSKNQNAPTPAVELPGPPGRPR